MTQPTQARNRTTASPPRWRAAGSAWAQQDRGGVTQGISLGRTAERRTREVTGRCHAACLHLVDYLDGDAVADRNVDDVNMKGDGGSPYCVGETASNIFLERGKPLRRRCSRSSVNAILGNARGVNDA